MEDFYEVIEQVCFHALLYLAAYFAPIKESTIIILVLIGFDLVTGVWKAVKQEGSIFAIKSHKLRDTVSKTVQYAMFIMAIFLLEKGVLDVSWGLTKVAIFSIGIIEVVSLCENLFAISGNALYNSFSVVLRDKFKALINSLK